MKFYFQLKDPVGFCTNNPDETFTLVGYQLYNLNSSECESSTPELVESDLLVELGVDSVDQVDLDYACVNETSDQSKCTTVASAVKDVEDYENQHGLLFQAENKCQIRMNEYESCAAVMKEKTLSDFKQGNWNPTYLSYFYLRCRMGTGRCLLWCIYCPDRCDDQVQEARDSAIKATSRN